jgi:hypothetical protein
MLATLIQRYWTLIGPALRQFVPSGRSVELLACARCGWKLTARRTDGTSSFAFENDSPDPKSGGFRHSVAVMGDGKLSILCGSEQSDSDASEDSGRDAGISSLTTSYDDRRLVQHVVNPLTDSCIYCARGAESRKRYACVPPEARHAFRAGRFSAARIEHVDATGVKCDGWIDIDGHLCDTCGAGFTRK